MHRGTAASNPFELNQNLGSVLGPLHLMSTNKHEVNAARVVSVFEGGNLFVLTVNSNQVQITNHGLKVIPITLRSLTKFGIERVYMWGISIQRGVMVTCKKQHVTLRYMSNALSDGIKNVLPITEKYGTIFL